MNRTCLPDPEAGIFEMTKNSTFGGGDSGFSGSRDESGIRSNETRLSVYSSISGGCISMRMGEFLLT